MVGAQVPFLYEAEKVDDARYPKTTFDPKAVTRASFQSQRPRPKQDGPLVNINRHPDAHEAPARRSMYWKPMSGRTKWWIKATRVVQLVLRVLELIAAAGVLTMFILMNHVEDVISWVMRITAAIICVQSIYAIHHLSRSAAGRTPGSSGAYHFFAVLYDVAVIALYIFGIMSCRNSSEDWASLLADQSTIDYFLPATYYTLIGAGGCHVISLLISIWLALMFRRIHKMPPDMNPLESHLTSRAHKKNKSSVTTFSTYADSDLKRLSTPLSEHRRSGAPYENVSLSRPPSIPFMHTRQGSETSLQTRDSRTDLPHRQYQVLPANRSPRSSIGSQADLRHMSDAPPVPSVPPRSSWHNSYTETPPPHVSSKPSSPRNSRPGTSYHDTTQTRPSTGTAVSYRTAQSTTAPPTPPAHASSPSREPRLTEAWYASESLQARTNARQKSLDKLTGPPLPKPSVHKSYEALDQRYDNEESIYTDDENVTTYPDAVSDESDSDHDFDAPKLQPLHPLRSNPTTPQQVPRAKWPLGQATHSNPSRTSIDILGDSNLNDRRVSGSNDIADQRKMLNRKSSIQPETEFMAKPYGTLKPGTPPVMVGGGRQVSSGYDDGRLGGSRFSVFGRRNVSGKVVEEGRAGEQKVLGMEREVRKGDYRDW